MAALRVSFFDGFRVSIGGEHVARWRAGKARSLLQYLVLHRGRIAPKAMLEEALWPETPFVDGSSRLKVAVHAARRALLDVGSGATIVFRDGGYGLMVDEVEVDAEVFDDLVHRAAAAARAGDPATEQAMARAALATHRGDFLPDEDAAWAVEAREWYRARASEMVEVLLRRARADRDVTAVLALNRRALALDPYNEKVYQRLIDGHRRRGELGLARSWYTLCVRRLAELDLAPSRSTSALLAGTAGGTPR